MLGRGALVLAVASPVVFATSSSYLLKTSDNDFEEIITPLISDTKPKTVIEEEKEEVVETTKTLIKKSESDLNLKESKAKVILPEKLKDVIIPDLYSRINGKGKAKLMARNNRNTNKKIIPIRGRMPGSIISKFLKT